MFRCSIPAITAILELALFGKRRTLRVYLSLIPVIVGTMLVCLGDVHFLFLSNSRSVTLLLVFCFFWQVVLYPPQRALSQNAFSRVKTQSRLSNFSKLSRFFHSLISRTPSSVCSSCSSSFSLRNGDSSSSGCPPFHSVWFSCFFCTAFLPSYWTLRISKQCVLEVRWWWMWWAMWSRSSWWFSPFISSTRRCGPLESSAVPLPSRALSGIPAVRLVSPSNL